MSDLVKRLRTHLNDYSAAVEAADRIEALEAALREAERFVSYLANETDGHFVGSGTPTTCLVMIRAALAPEQAKPPTRVTGATDIVDEASCLIWSELCPDTVMGDEDRPYYEAAAKAVLALSPAPEGEAVAWQKRPVFGDIRLRVWTPVEADPEVQDFWRTVNYEIRPLYATPQSISTREAVIEECAKLCEGLRHVDYPAETSEWSSGTFDCAEAIRALVRSGK
jgi:hypothetical protein